LFVDNRPDVDNHVRGVKAKGKTYVAEHSLYPFALQKILLTSQEDDLIFWRAAPSPADAFTSPFIERLPFCAHGTSSS